MKSKYIRNRNKTTSPGKTQQDQHGEFEQLATEIDKICRRKLPDGTIRGGILGGREPEIRQHALEMTMGGFLARNPDYARAKIHNDLGAIPVAIERATAVALRLCKARLARTLSKESSRHTQVTEQNGGISMHPAALDVRDWSNQIKHGVLTTGIVRALQLRKLSVANAEIAAMKLEEGLSVVEIARILKITPGAVYQRLDRVRAVLPKVIESIEAPYELW